MERIFEIMDTPADVHDREGAPELPPIEGRVTFDDVTFSYDPEKVILKNVSFDVLPGQTIALVGPTGAGKSTVVNLISRFYDVTGGAVKIDGHDVRDVKLSSLRRQMSVMMQDSFIFSGTIMDNIRYGRLTASDEEVIQAAQAVSAHDFIMQMEKGYLTEVNERGSSLSVGQKQLISFARALLNDPKILILDEATSSIDTHTELLIQKALDVLLKGRTSFVIAHRLSTIRNADNIMVIQDGHVAESGTHEQLIALSGGHYKALSDAQYRFLLSDQ
jgi:ATP-binding cassette subfamily B protein